MSMLIDSVEDRLRYKIGQLILENEALYQQISDLEKKLEDERAKNQEVDNGQD